jgi:aspartyl-tRNA(Asn)/glutamyl-tRNA(Gln) amidotransferase subunit B
MITNAYEAVIGLEVHAQLKTKSKIFCGCSIAFGADPNSQTCPVCLGMPGVLPVLNRTAVEFALKMGLATACTIAPVSIFARKNYFYPDLPKGYQISQYEQPICQNGHIQIEVDGQRKTIGITRIHLEEDAGKSVHDEAWVDENSTLIDINRCGTPLIEIVSEPDFRSPQEAYAYLTKLRQLVRYLGICDGNMEEGSMRCDANISIRPVGQKQMGTKTELKNMNSFRNVEHALTFEIERQISLVKSGETISQTTLLWDAAANEARIMRSKEEAHDYRYFPEPDLVPVRINEEWLAACRNTLPELPDVRKKRFITTYELPVYDAEILTASREMADYFEAILAIYANPKIVSNWLMGEVLRILKEQQLEIDRFSVSPANLAQLLILIDRQEISVNAAKKVFSEMLSSRETPDQIINRLGLKQVSDDSALESLIENVLNQNPVEVQQYKSGKIQLLGFFMGQVMRLSGGKANPQMVNELLRNKLGAH